MLCMYKYHFITTRKKSLSFSYKIKHFLIRLSYAQFHFIQSDGYRHFVFWVHLNSFPLPSKPLTGQDTCSSLLCVCMTYSSPRNIR